MVQFSLMKNTTVLYIQFYTHTLQTNHLKAQCSLRKPNYSALLNFKNIHTTTDWSTLQWMGVKNREASQSENEGRKWHGNCAVWTCEMWNRLKSAGMRGMRAVMTKWSICNSITTGCHRKVYKACWRQGQKKHWRTHIRLSLQRWPLLCSRAWFLFKLKGFIIYVCYFLRNISQTLKRVILNIYK